MENAALFNPSSAVPVTTETHLQPSRDRSRKRSSTGAGRELSEVRKHIKRDEVEKDDKIEEDDMAEEDYMVKKVRAQIERLRLERKSKGVERQDESGIRLRSRLFCCSCEDFTGAKTHKCFSCGHHRCPVCYVGK